MRKNFLFFYFLFIAPFLNVYSSWFGKDLVFIIMLIPFALMTLTKKTLYSIHPKAILISGIPIFLLFISFLLSMIFNDTNIWRWVYFFGAQSLILIFYSLYIRNFIVFNLFHSKYFLYLFIFISFSIIYDYIVLNMFGDPSMRIIENTNPSYSGKPLGIFGQFSVNAVYLILSYSLYLYSSGKSFFNAWLAILCLVIFMQNSGVGYVLLIMFIFYSISLGKKSHFKLLSYFSVLSFVCYFFLFKEVSEKLTIDYITYIFYGLPLDISIHFLNEVSLISIFTGFDYINNNFPLDITPLFIIAKVGTVFLIFYIFLFIYLLLALPKGYLKFSILTIIIGSLHYPTIFYPIGSLLMPAIILHTIYYYYSTPTN